MLTFLLVLLIISLLIISHELGHFYAARWLKIKVEEFGFGFPPKIWSKTKNGITYTINALPFGGFVKIYGEHGEGENDTKSFISRPVWQRFTVLAAGVFMNLVLAWFLFSLGSIIGVPQIDDQAPQSIPITIISILPHTPAESSGLKFGDKILELRGRDLTFHPENEKDIIDFISAYRGEEVTLKIQRGSETKEIKAVPRGNYPEGEGPLGIALARLIVTRTAWYKAPWEGFKTLLNGITVTVEGLGYLLKELFIKHNTSVPVSGPVGIFMLIGDTSSLGIAYLLQFVGMLSINLAILNFLPIPALDGGRILFLLIEKARRKKFNPDWENFAHAAGFILLLIIMVLVTYKDIVKVF